MNFHDVSYIEIVTAVLLSTLTFIAPVSEAGNITIRNEVQAYLTGDHLVVQVEVTNDGDEPAYQVQVSVDVGEQSKVSDVLPVLDVKERLEKEFGFLLSFAKPGNYPVLVRVDYSGGNQYPLSIPSLLHIRYKGAADPQVSGKIESLQMTKKGRAHLMISNLDERQKELTVRLLLPEQLSGPEDVKKIQLGPKQEREVVFTIKNLSPPGTATHPIFALLEYDDKEMHYSTSVSGTAKIEEKRKLTAKERSLLLGIPIGLFVAFLLFLLIRRRKGEPV